MSEQTKTALTAEEIAKLIATEIKAYQQGDPPLRAKHLKLACEEFSEETINALWDEAEANRPPPRPEPKTQPNLRPPEQIPAASNASRAVSFVKRWPPVEAKAVEAEVKAAPAPNSVVAPEAKRRALIKFNPVKNPYNQNGFENAGLALDLMEFDCRLDLFHNKPIIQGKHAWLGGDGFEDIDNVVLKLRQLINDEFGFDPNKAGMFDALRVRCLDHAFDPLLQLPRQP